MPMLRKADTSASVKTGIGASLLWSHFFPKIHHVFFVLSLGVLSLYVVMAYKLSSIGFLKMIKHA